MFGCGDCINDRNRELKLLSLTRNHCAERRIYFPQASLPRQVFETDFAFHVGSEFAEPYDPKLRLRSFILEVKNIAGLELCVDALESGAAAADGAQTRGLCEGARVSVHAPNLYGQIHENALLPATVHCVILGVPAGKTR
jgi:hypothetical protein